MPQRQNFRGRPENRFRYNAPPGRGGRGGFNRPPGGGFQHQRRDSPQHGRQQNNKPNVNDPKGNNANSNTNSPSAKTAGNVQPLMAKEIPVPVTKTETITPVKAESTEAVVKGKTNPPATTPAGGSSGNSKPTPPPSASSTGTDSSGTSVRPDRSSSNQTGTYQTTPNTNRSGPGQGHMPQSQGQGGRHGGRGFQDRRQQQQQQQRFGPSGQGYFQGEQQPPSQPMDVNEDLQTEKRQEKKFTGRCRLFIGNLPNETTDEEFKKIFEKFGEINEVFLNKQKMFGFIRLDTRLNAEAAKNEMDGATFKGRVIRVRFAAHGAALKVKNLSHVVSNELLEEAFSVFGEVERAIVIVDDRGKSTNEGIVEFARKPAAQAAIKKIKEGVFLLTSSTRPITVEPLEQKNDDDGLPEKNVPKTPVFYQEREVPPRFAQRNSFEFEWGQRWKQQALEEENKRAQLDAEIQANREKLVEEVELARHDYHTRQMREELIHRQKELERLEEQRKDLEARRHGLQRQREDRFGSPMNEDPMMRQRQPEGMQARNEGMEMQQGMRPEEMSRREGERFIAGGGSGGGLPPPPPPPPLLMDGSGKGMMGGQAGEMQTRPSRFDQPGAGAGFNGNARGNLPPGGIGGASPSQQVGAVGGNFGGQNIPGNLGGGVNTNPRPLMEEIRDMERGGDRRGDYGANAKRPRRF